MKVLVLTKFMASYGGIPYSLLNLYSGKRSINDTLNEIDIAILDKKTLCRNLLSRLISNNISNIIIGEFQSLKFLIKNQKKYEFIITTCFRTFFLANIFAPGKKVILWFRGANILNTTLKKNIFLFLNKTPALTNSRYTGLINGFLDSQFFTVYNGIDNKVLQESSNDFNTRFNIPENAKTLCYIGGWSEIKNHEVLLKAFEIIAVSNKNLYLLIIGETSSLTNKLISKINQSIAKRIIIAGKVYNAAKYLKNIDIYVHSCYSEGFGNSVIEAIRAKRRVLTSNAGSFPEFIHPDFMFPFNDTLFLARKIKFLLETEFDPSNDILTKDFFTIEKYYKNFIKALQQIRALEYENIN